MNKNILVTGTNGQLGLEIQQIKDRYPEFGFFFTDIDTLDISCKFEVQTFLKEHPTDYIVNCAAFTAVDKAEDEKVLCDIINSKAVENLAEAASGKTKIIHISTDYVFDGKGNIPLKETDLTNPQSVYGKSKLDGERLLLANAPDSIIIRTSWLYSPFGGNFVKTMLRLGQEKKILKVVNDQTGSPTYAADLAQAILQIIEYSEKETKFSAGIYHYSDEGVCSWYDFCLKIFELAGIHTCKVEPIPTSEYPTKAIRPKYSVLDKTKIKQTFGLEIPRWEESLKKCIDILMR